MAVLSALKIICLMNKVPSCTVLCYTVFIDGRKFLVKIGHADEFLSLYQGDTIVFDSATLRWVKFDNPLNWYIRVDS